MVAQRTSLPRRRASSCGRPLHSVFSSSVSCMTSGTSNTSCSHCVNMMGTRWPRCSASEEGPCRGGGAGGSHGNGTSTAAVAGAGAASALVSGSSYHHWQWWSWRGIGGIQVLSAHALAVSMSRLCQVMRLHYLLLGSLWLGSPVRWSIKPSVSWAFSQSIGSQSVGRFVRMLTRPVYR